MIIGSKDMRKPGSEVKIAFILNTCAKSARDEFAERTGMDIVQCMQTAESSLTKDDLKSRDLWAEGRNWMAKPAKKVESPALKRYLELCARAVRVQAAKRELGIKDWDLATEEQLTRLNTMLSE